MPPPEPVLKSARYRALCSRDARFDGRFFVGVTSTGIYCRPICRVRTPKQENCLFFDHAAQAEHAGFRPCLRCRPELAPFQRHWSTTDATGILVHQASLLLDDPEAWPGTTGASSRIHEVAARLGVSDRHLRRIFEKHLEVSPLQYLQTSRLLTAKQLLTDTQIPITVVAQASGFSSLRRFNAAFLAHYRITPSRMRRKPTSSAHSDGASGQVGLAWRPPLDVGQLMQFFAARQLDPVERFVTGERPSFHRTMRIANTGGGAQAGWIRGHWEVDQCILKLEVSESLLGALPAVLRRVRAWFDLDADPAPVNEVLQHDFVGGEGLRVPGCLDGFELAVRAILGQQITVAAARTLLSRLVLQHGEVIEGPVGQPDRLFPSPQALLAADDAALGAIGIVAQRQRALKALALAVLEGRIELNAHGKAPITVRELLALPGIGPWTAQYIAMRALRDPDAWPEGDVALHNLLKLEHPKTLSARRRAEQMAEAWRPWRSYAVIRTWSGCYRPCTSPSNPKP